MNRRAIHASTLVVLAVLLSSAVVPVVVRAHQPERFVPRADDSTPLATAISEVERRYGGAITYEDPIYEHPSELREVAPLPGAPDPSRRAILVPRGGLFSAEVESTCSALVDGFRCAQHVVDAYNSSGNPGQFEVVRIEGMVHVIPSASVDAAGQVASRRSLRATRVEISPGERTLAAFLEDVIAAVEAAEGVKIDRMGGPANLLAATVVQPTRTNDMALSTLSRELHRVADGRLSWRLRYAPETRSYMLTLHVVPSRTRK